MSTPNPYERRHRRGEGMDLSSGALGYARGRMQSVIALEDLDAMVQSAIARERERAAVEFDQRERKARLEAWHEGRDAGVSDGKAELLQRIDDRVGGMARQAKDHAGMAILVAREGSKDDQIRALIEALGHADAALDGLIRAHHAGFADEPPF